MRSVCISATASNQGKTVLTTALLYHYKKKVRPFKIGPDFIDPLFHEKICEEKSVNLDTCIMNKEQIQWMFNHYASEGFNILEGVMGFYDGMDKGSSAYDVTTLLKIPTVIILDASGSYITLSAILKGLSTYKDDNTIKGVVFNKVSSVMHYELIAKQIKKDFKDIISLGWIKNNLEALNSIHLGLDLQDNKKEVLESISLEVLENIDLVKLEEITRYEKNENKVYPFLPPKKINKSIAVINDDNFCFLYHDNLNYLKAVFSNVIMVDATKDEAIPSVDVVYIPGGYVETLKAYEKIKNSNAFKQSLIKHALNKPIYAECAGLLYLSRGVDEKVMSGLLPLDFTLTLRPTRLGYYENEYGITGHAFHYTKLKDEEIKGVYKLYKRDIKDGKYAAFRKEHIFGTYLHTMFRNNFEKIKKDFGL